MKHTGYCLPVSLALVMLATSPAPGEGPSPEAVKESIRRLSDAKEEVRLQAAGQLEALGASAPKFASEAVGPLAKALGDPSPKVRIKAAEALMQFGPSAEAAVPALLGVLENKDDPGLRHKSVIALGLIHRRPKEVVPALTKVLKEKDGAPKPSETTLHQAAIAALIPFGPDAKGAVPELLERVRPGDKIMTGLCLGALASVKYDPKLFVPLLVKILKDKDYAEAWTATIGAVEHVGPEASETVPLLRKMFACDGIEDRLRVQITRESILLAVGAMGDKATKDDIAWVSKVARDPKMRAIQDTAFRALSRFGPAAKSEIPNLINCLNDVSEYGSYTNRINDVFAAIGADAVSPLADNLRGNSRHPTGRTLHALQKLGPKAKAAVPQVEALLKSEDPNIVMAAAITLESIKRDPTSPER